MAQTENLRQSSNYRKHTAANPLQRALIDRFHRENRAAGCRAWRRHRFWMLGAARGSLPPDSYRLCRNWQLPAAMCLRRPSNVAAATNPQARFLPGSVVELPFPDRSFDVVGCFEVLEHLPGDLPRLALAELSRVSRGTVLLSVPSRTSLQPGECRPRQEPRYSTSGQRSGSSPVVDTAGIRAPGRGATGRATPLRVVPVDDLRRSDATLARDPGATLSA